MQVVLRAVLTDVPYVLSTQLGILRARATCAFVAGLLRAGVGAPCRPGRDLASRLIRVADLVGAIRAELRGRRRSRPGAADAGLHEVRRCRTSGCRCRSPAGSPQRPRGPSAGRRLADLIGSATATVADRRIPRGALRRNGTDRTADGGRAARTAAAVHGDDRHRRLVGPRRRGVAADRRDAAGPPR